MKYLRSIELLRTVSKVLFKGQRNLARAEQLKTVCLLLSQVMKEVQMMGDVNESLLFDLTLNLKQVNETLTTICDLAGTFVKDEIITSFVNDDIAAVKSLAVMFDDFDEEFFDSLLEANDMSRILLYLNSIGSNRSVELDYAATILKGVHSVTYCLCNLFWLEYENKEIDTDEHLQNTLRYVCAMRNGIDLDVA